MYKTYKPKYWREESDKRKIHTKILGRGKSDVRKIEAKIK